MRRMGMLLVVVAMLVPAVPASAVLPPGGTFSDDNGNTHEPNIEAIAAAGVTQGCATGLYCPADNVTRAQMASFIARAFALPSASNDYFPDDNGSTHEANINRIAEAGVTLGYPDGTYDPSGFVTREQMASFIARAMALSPLPGDRFADVTGVHEGNINAIAAAGVTLGCNAQGTLYCPTQLVRRDQMASFLARARGLDPIPPPPPVTTITFGAGSYRVGTDIPPGRYRNTGFTSGCYWERVSDFTGDLGSIIANEFTSVGQVVDIASSDTGFNTDPECGTWTNDLSSSRTGNPAAPLTPGTWIVGQDVSPGLWQGGALAGDFCYWERRSGFGGNLADIIANDFTSSQNFLVEIRDTDVGFLLEDGCTALTKVG